MLLEHGAQNLLCLLDRHGLNLVHDVLDVVHGRDEALYVVAELGLECLHIGFGALVLSVAMLLVDYMAHLLDGAAFGTVPTTSGGNGILVGHDDQCFQDAAATLQVIWQPKEKWRGRAEG